MDDKNLREFVGDCRTKALDLYISSRESISRADETNRLLRALYWQQLAQIEILLAVKDNLDSWR